MSTTTLPLTRIAMATAVLVALWGVAPAVAVAGHHIHCDAHWEGYLLDYCPYPEVESLEYGCCYSSGHWDITIDTNDGSFVFHFNGHTNDQECRGLQEEFEGYPSWVAQELYYECGACIDDYESYPDTYVHIDHAGHVFMRITGYVYPCNQDS